MSVSRVALERMLAGASSQTVKNGLKIQSHAWQPVRLETIRLGGFRWNSTITNQKDSTSPTPPITVL
jgi:hypothetical protein